MSLVVAFNLNDYVILAADKRGTIGYGNRKEEIVVSVDDHYQKLRKIPFGYFVAAGDYFLTELFYQECLRETVIPRNLDQILKETYDRYINLDGVCHFGQNTDILLIAKGFNDQGKFQKDAILQITFEQGKINIEEVKLMSLVALMANMNPDPAFWDKMGTNLRESHDFNNFEDFLNYHMHLIKYIWQEQLKFDNLISHYIDFYFHDRNTGKGLSLSAEEFAMIPYEVLEHFPKISEQISSNG